MSLALWISFSRISDYFHHPLDVTVGAFLGTLMVIMQHTVKTKTLLTKNLEAFVTMSFSRLRKEDLAFGRFYPEEIRLFYDLFALSVIP